RFGARISLPSPPAALPEAGGIYANHPTKENLFARFPTIGNPNPRFFQALEKIRRLASKPWKKQRSEVRDQRSDCRAAEISLY
ncbi:MAG: hypothetical protein NTY53_06815, partial [Kiritimatiellaeota bacterium]|nr:hypothetical protein [Kiritimatiellota bacterium]